VRVSAVRCAGQVWISGRRTQSQLEHGPHRAGWDRWSGTRGGTFEGISAQSSAEPAGVATVTQKFSRSELVSRLVRAGELEVSGEDQAEVDTYFDRENFRFHGPDGFESDYAGLTAYFASIRAAFDDRKITRGIIVAEGNTVACQTWIEGTFAREFTQSPAGSLPPTGTRVVWDLINIFRFDDDGRLIEEFVRTDYRSFLRQLGAEGR
jgi:predicted ester cyclase